MCWKDVEELLNLDASKACQDKDIDIQSRILKENADIFTDILHYNFNNSIYQSEFPSILKLTNITPVIKKGDRNSTENYRPVNILSNISKNLWTTHFSLNFQFYVFLSIKATMWVKGKLQPTVLPVGYARKMKKCSR